MIQPAEAEGLKESLEQLLDFKKADLVRRKELGEIHCLKDIDEPAKRVLSLFSRIDPTGLEKLSGHNYSILDKSVEEFLAFFHRVRLYDPAEHASQPDYAEELDSLVTDHFPKLQLIIDYLFPIDEEVSNRLNSIKETEKQIKDLLATAKESAAKSGVGENAAFFSSAAKSHQKGAIQWLFTIIGSGLLLVLLALFSPLLSKISWFYDVGDIQVILIKFIIFTAIGSFMVVAIRNYSAHRHNGLVNSHREKALQTFERLVKASPDEETKAIILMHASACIFSPQPTGFTKEVGQLPLPLSTEAIKRVTD